MDGSQIYLARHTTPEVDKGICYGQADIPLKESFKIEAKRVKNQLAGIRFQSVYSSPLSRCVELVDFLGYKYKTDDRLLELNFGDWELKHWDELYKTIEFQAWAENYTASSPPKGETFDELIQRVKDFYCQCVQNTDKPVLIITHSGVIRCFYIFLKELDTENIFNIDIPFGSLHKF